MCKFIGKSNERILCKLSKSKILRLYSIVHVAMETTKTSHFTCQSKSFISIFFTCQVSACELQPFSCHDFANDICSQTVKTVFSHLNGMFCTHSKRIFFPHEMIRKWFYCMGSFVTPPKEWYHISRYEQQKWTLKTC